MSSVKWPRKAMLLNSLLFYPIPILVWIFSAFDIVESEYLTIDHILMGAYMVLAVSMTLVHNATGCSKCDITECSFSKAAKLSRSKAL